MRIKLIPAPPPPVPHSKFTFVACSTERKVRGEGIVLAELLELQLCKLRFFFQGKKNKKNSQQRSSHSLWDLSTRDACPALQQIRTTGNGNKL